MGDMKRCVRCGEAKAASEFHRRGKGTQNRCKPCATAWVDEWRKANPERYRASRIKYYFGIDADHYDELLRAQGGVCAGCGHPERARGRYSGEIKRLAVDHDHSCCPGDKSCGKCVRGLLCSRCNLGIGYFDDDPERLERVVRYLRKYALQG